MPFCSHGQLRPLQPPVLHDAWLDAKGAMVLPRDHADLQVACLLHGLDPLVRLALQETQQAASTSALSPQCHATATCRPLTLPGWLLLAHATYTTASDDTV
jgi:hypothetical protein